MKRYDCIVIGAGHNGLVCAAYLARKGKRVLVVEAGERPGGLAAAREFHPGFKTSVAHSVNHFAPEIARELGLPAHGFPLATEYLPTIGLAREGEHVVIQGDSVSGVSADDAGRFPDYRAILQRFAEALRPFWLKTIPGVGNNSLGELLTFAQLGLRLRLLGKDDMLEFMRVATLPMRDLMDENFDSEVLKAALSWDGLIGAKLAPRSPNSAVFALLYRMSTGNGGGHCVSAASVDSLVSALESAAGAAGVEIRCNAPVRRITVEPGESGLAVTGVELDSGELIEGERVISSADPKRTFLDLVGAQHLEIEFSNRISRLRCEGYVAKLHLALSDLPRFTGLDRPDGRIIIAPTMDAIEFAFDDAKYGESSRELVMECLLPSLRQTELAPSGQHVLSAHIMYVPANPKGGWSDAARSALLERAVTQLEQYAPGLRELVLHAELLTPHDLEQHYRVTGGHWHHTEFAVDQMLMMRPTYEAAQYSTPLPGLYLCGAGTHPGGDLMGGAGYNAAREILR